LAVAAVFVVRELRSPPPSQGRSAAQAVDLEGWERYVDRGMRRGPDDAPVSLIEFVDFQCPFCRQQATRIDSLLAEFPDEVQVTTHHFPLTSIQPLAKPGAEAVECAAIQGYGEDFAALVFQKQDSLGVKDWTAFAEAAGVPDLSRLEQCRTGSHYFPRISTGMALGEQAGVRSTPTLVVNGWKLPRPPSSTEELREITRSVLRGEPPATGDTVSVEPPNWEWTQGDSIPPSELGSGPR